MKMPTIEELSTAIGKVIAGTVAVVAILVLGLWIAFHETDARNIDALTAMAHLEALPESARGVKVHKYSSFTYRAYCLKFSASPDDIDKFLSRSHGVPGGKVEKLTMSHKLLPISSASELSTLNVNFYAGTFEDNARWFIPPVITHGRRYELTSTEDMDQGYIIVDDTRHVVYIYATLG
ncbi:MAG TPA: hypothetical protein VGK19_05425 [Capsulimonadaceae bacterium]|jgi:hypothetical protein